MYDTERALKVVHLSESFVYQSHDRIFKIPIISQKIGKRDDI